MENPQLGSVRMLAAVVALLVMLQSLTLAHGSIAQATVQWVVLTIVASLDIDMRR